jgi:hypothetical protein
MRRGVLTSTLKEDVMVLPMTHKGNGLLFDSER